MKEWVLGVTTGAFTLIELLVVVAIISILTAMLLPALGKAVGQARKASCVGNLRQFALCHHLYAESFDGWYPQGGNFLRIDAVNTLDDFNGFYPTDIFVCPASEYIGKLNGTKNPAYAPGYYWELSGNWLEGYMNTTYRFLYGTRGTRVDDSLSTVFWGRVLNLQGCSPVTTKDSQYVVPTPGSRFAGRFLDARDGNTPKGLYIQPPSRQPIGSDARGHGGGYYYFCNTHYNAANHPRLNGRNIVFMDGHVQWGHLHGDPDRIKIEDGVTGWGFVRW